jgi:hypothetical protein
VHTWSQISDLTLAGATQVSLWYVYGSTCTSERAGKS